MPITVKEVEETIDQAVDVVRQKTDDVRRRVRAAKRDALDARDDLVHLIRREPLKAAAIAFAAGAALGAVAAAIAGWRRPRAECAHD